MAPPQDVCPREGTHQVLKQTRFQGSRPETGSYLRRIDSCITQLKAQGPSRTCDENKEEEEALKQTRFQGRHQTDLISEDNVIQLHFYAIWGMAFIRGYQHPVPRRARI